MPTTRTGCGNSRVDVGAETRKVATTAYIGCWLNYDVRKTRGGGGGVARDG